MNSYRLEEPNTFHLKVETPDDSIDFDINSFIELFIDDAPLGRYCNKLFGISTYNYAQKIYTVTFNSKTTEKEMDDFLKLFENVLQIELPDKTSISITAWRSRWASKIVTLYPIPFDISTSLIQEITKNWGKLEAFNFGRHKKFSFLRNPYLHLRFTDLQTDYIPETIKINDRYITVILPGEENINRCNYCKSKNHCIEQCVIKPGNKIPKTYANVSKTNSNIIKDPKPVASRSLSPIPLTKIFKTSTIRKITPPKPTSQLLTLEEPTTSNLENDPFAIDNYPPLSKSLSTSDESINNEASQSIPKPDPYNPDNIDYVSQSIINKRKASISSLSPSANKSPTTQKSKKKMTPKKKKGKN